MITQNNPNVIIVLTDDQGYGDFRCHGNETICTPNLDSLYNESLHLTDFHMAPTCAPARAGLMTGQYNDKVNVWHTIGGRSILRKGIKTMGEIYRDAGYKTAVFGKWHLGDNYPYRAQDRGFDEAIIHRGGGIGQTPDFWGNDYFTNVFDNMGAPQRFEGYCTDVFFNLTMDFIKRNKSNPFLVYLAPNAPHYPLRVEQKYYDMYKGKMPENRAKCYGMLTNIDDNVGRLREFLDDESLAENTIFIYATDNGGEFGFSVDKQLFVIEGHNDGMRGRKACAYEGGHRVPCFIHYPNGDMTEKRDIAQCTSNMDILPTIMELCGLDSRLLSEFDGKSIVPLLKDKEPRWDSRPIIVDSQRVTNPVKWKTSCVMYDKWRLINQHELYNLDKDFEQRTNVAEKYPHIVIMLQNFYEEWWEKISTHFEVEISISIGNTAENPVFLSSHDWRGSEEESIWNQGEVRRGVHANSYFEILVEAEGEYNFELRRWPREANLGITEGIAGDLSDYSEWYKGGKALKIISSALEVQGQRFERAVSNDDKYISLDVSLKKGTTHVQSYFYEENGSSLGAYYLYVTCKNPVSN